MNAISPADLRTVDPLLIALTNQLLRKAPIWEACTRSRLVRLIAYGEHESLLRSQYKELAEEFREAGWQVDYEAEAKSPGIGPAPGGVS